MRHHQEANQSHSGSKDTNMTETPIDDLNVLEERPLVTPATLKAQFPLSGDAEKTIIEARKTIRSILSGADPRLLVVVGPCSIHDPKAALDYATRLKTLSESVKEHLFLVMRVYFEKPRTTVGWKGFINDPHLDDSFHIEEGLRLGRELLVSLADMGIPTATEALDPVSPQYLQDLISWSAIGARTAESQTHREMASGLSSAVGFKNGTDGSLDVAINALKSVSTPHRFLGINHDGLVSIIETRGNRHAHVVLRGGAQGPNYDADAVQDCEQQLVKAGIRPNIMIDCSHANSNKDPANQTRVIDDVAAQINNGNRSIIGLMIESHLAWGNQSIPQDLSELKYGVSVTDACIDWTTTERALSQLANDIGVALSERLLPLEQSA
jgi:3-deoxy-7-phosphoheptulonate synthase